MLFSLYIRLYFSNIKEKEKLNSVNMSMIMSFVILTFKNMSVTKLLKSQDETMSSSYAVSYTHLTLPTKRIV